MARFTLQNSEIVLEVDTLGAQWTRLHAFSAAQSCLWSGKDIWPRQAPLLFPIVGRLNEDAYLYCGEKRRLPQHGFARDSEFEIVERSDYKIKLCLLIRFLPNYPFSCDLFVTYEISGNVILTTYEVVNLSSVESLPFSIGAHPGFSYEWLPAGKKWSDVNLTFESPEGDFALLSSGLLDTGRTAAVKLEDRRLQLACETFSQDAWVLFPVKSSSVEISVAQSSRKIRMFWENAAAFGIWSKSVSDFFCLEPWWGVPDPVGFNGELTQKPGIERLGPLEHFRRTWGLEFSE